MAVACAAADALGLQVGAAHRAALRGSGAAPALAMPWVARAALRALGARWPEDSR